MTRRRLLIVAKSLLAAVLIGAVGRHFAILIQSSDFRVHPEDLSIPFLILSGFFYLAAHLIWATFFVQLLWSQGAQVSWIHGIRAYFVSQLGKYVPGKAWVIVLRGLLLKPYGVSTALAWLAGTYETLTSMAAGAIIAVILLPWAAGISIEVGSLTWIGLAGLAALPIALALISRLAIRVMQSKKMPGLKSLHAPSLWLLTRGLLQDSVGWCLLGCSLWAAIEGIGLAKGPLSVQTYLEDLAATSLSYVIGFVILISPGGLGAREYVLKRVLCQQMPEAEAAVVAIVVRLIWTLFEVIMLSVLYFFAGSQRAEQATNVLTLPTDEQDGIEMTQDPTTTRSDNVGVSHA